MASQAFTVSSGALYTFQIMLLDLSEYINTNITTSNIDTQEATLLAIQQTLINSLNILDAYTIQTLMAQEYSLLSRILSANLNLSVSDQALITNRINSFNYLVNSIYPIPQWLQFNLDNLAQGIPAIQGYDLLAYYIAFNNEVAPTGINLTNFYSLAQAEANAWLNVLNYLTINGTTFQVSAYNSVDRMYQSAYDLYANVLVTTNPDGSVAEPNLVFATGVNPSYAWNTIVALPTLLRVASVLANDPSSPTSQSTNAIKYLIYIMLGEINALLVTFSEANNVTLPVLADLRVGESLMDFAARTTGSTENWTTIAALNNLQPPYISNIAGVNVATPGQNLYIPGSTGTGITLNDYLTAYLGTDISFGPLFSTLTTWTGDFATDSGYNNYLQALARRVMTNQNNLIYHTDYGSLLRQEVGNVRSANSASLLSSYLNKALISDVRTETVSKILAVPYNSDQILLSTTVKPKGSLSAKNFSLVVVPTLATNNVQSTNA